MLRSPLPSEPGSSALLTFLIADVRGYTAFTSERGDEAAARLADRFAELCQSAVERHGGEVIELRGDEALCIFSSARNALRGAVALQQAFRESVRDDPSLPLKVGIGIDAGDVIPVRGGYRGGALNLAARLCSIAAAGEILATETATGLARRTEGLVFVGRGQVTLKGLAQPVRVLQIGREGELPDELPPLQPLLATHPTNLPDEPTPFIGREGEIEELTRLLREPQVRLVTLTGPGGTGKTRLALQAAGALLYDFQDGVFLASLAPLADPSLVPSAIATALEVKEEGDAPLVETLAEHLLTKQLLLVLDNFEHLLDAGEVVSSLLERCRGLHMLVTSRIPLHLTRENEYPVAPLPVPDLERLPPFERLSQYDSVALFTQRAGAVRPGFAVTNENAPAVAEICSQLDGLPLAIELAAARIKLFPPQALLGRLSSRLTLLTGGARDRPTRQQTLRGTLDWSYSLLSEEEQACFWRLSVFAGGCTFEAAESVCNPDGSIDVLEGLASLVDKSLLRQEGEEEPRFAMLETIREYAAERLQESSEADEICAAHARYFHNLAQQAEPGLEGSGQAVWLPRLDAELPNIRAAVRWLLDHGQDEQAVQTGNALFFYWIVRGHYRELLEWLEEVGARANSLPPAVRAWAHFGLATAKIGLGDFVSARADLEESIGVFRRLGDAKGLRKSLLSLGLVTGTDAPEDGARALEESISLARERDPWTANAALLLLGNHMLYQGRFPEARVRYEEALQGARKRGDTFSTALLLMNLAEVARLQGDLNEARARVNEGLALAGGASTPETTAVGVAILGFIHAENGEYRPAAECFGEAIHLAANVGDKRRLDEFIGYVGGLMARQGDFQRAARLLSAAAVLDEEFGLAIPALDRASRDSALAQAQDQLAPEDWARASVEGQSMSFDEAVAYALEALKQTG